MRSVVVSRVLLVVHGSEEPEDRDWEHFLKLLGSHSELIGVLVYTPGPGPGSQHRARIAKISEKRNVPFAVCSSSRLARGIVTVLSWFGVPIKAFDASRTDDAIAHLNIPEADRETIKHEFELLKRALNGESMTKVASW
jgi:hypothetical protein